MVKQWLHSIEQDLKEISIDRHSYKLPTIVDFIRKEQEAGRTANLVFICTHNSRRSQFAQTWCNIVQKYLGLDVVKSYSGGTEETACNPRTVKALERTGLQINKKGSDNPVYTVTDEDLSVEVELWSKLYDDPSNPSDRFAAIMTCDHADANCPFIPGAALRVPLTYTDPKHSDGTEAEVAAYDETCKIIATDMMRLFLKVRDEQPS